jgi:serine/threonine protein kinase/tetratricopeptide (TPR) repeat protein
MNDSDGHDEQNREDALAEIIDQCMELLRSGQQPDVHALAAQHPDLADQIREFVPLLLLVEQPSLTVEVPADTQFGAGTAAGSADRPDRVGEYRITGEIGRGGMGIVYRAVQESLDREVALKLLPPALVSSVQSRARFLREATAAAALHHTNIVPVFEVGHADDIWFYAMQFIDGVPLDQLQREVVGTGLYPERVVGLQPRSGGRSNSHSVPASSRSATPHVDRTSAVASTASDQGSVAWFRNVARIGIQVADALDYAHSRKIVHRDIKPANLILDQQGVVWLTDFGLALIGESDVTVTGQFPGTTRYMSPERFQGICEPSSDIYALGVTLYEMLTLQPAFPARDRLQLIQQIANLEPRRPGEIDRRIPRDLETIVLKAMEKDPARRYATAFDLMEDLRRFSAGEPITARPISPLERTLKWVRRYPAVSALAVSLILVGSIGFMVSTWKWREAVRERDQKTAAQLRAETNLSKAREAVQRMLMQVGDSRLSSIPQMEILRRQLLQEALEFNRGFLEDSDDPETRRDVAVTHASLGNIQRMLGALTEATSSYGQSVRQLTQLQADQPERAELVYDLADVLVEFSACQELTGDFDSAIESCRRAAEALESLTVTDARTDRHHQTVMLVHARTADILNEAGRLQESLRSVELALQAFDRLSPGQQTALEPQRLYTSVIALRGAVLLALDDPVAAAEVLEQAIESGQRLIDADPMQRQFRETQATTLVTMAAAHRKLGAREQNRVAQEQAVSEYESLARDFPQITDYRKQVGGTAIGLAISFAETGDYELAERWFIRGSETAQQLSEDVPSNLEYTVEAARAIRVLGIFYLNSRQLKKAGPVLEDAIARFEALAKQHPDNPSIRYDIALTAHPLGTFHRTQSDIDGAIRWTRRAIELSEQLLLEMDNTVRLRHKLSQSYRQLGSLLAQNEGPMEQALSSLQQAVDIERHVVQDAPDLVEHSRHLAIALHELADLHLNQSDFLLALPLIQESVEIRKRLMNEQPTWLQPKAELPRAYCTLGLTLEGLSHMPAAGEAYQQAIDLCAAMWPALSQDANIREDYARAMEHRAHWLIITNRRAEALELGATVLQLRAETADLFPDTVEFQERCDDWESQLDAWRRSGSQ